MSVQSTDTERAVDYSTMTLDALRRLAEHGPDAATRAGARRELEGRAAPAGEHIVMCRVNVGQSEYTTPRPRIVMSLRGLRGHRHVAAVLYDIAAELERMLADTVERWHVGVAVYPHVDDVGEVYLELMTGSTAEVQRAVSVLERLAGQTVTTGRSAGRRPARGQRRVAGQDREGSAALPDTAVDEPDSTRVEVAAVAVEPTDRVPAAPSVADESESRSRRRKRQRYRELAADAADTFEREQLADDRAMLPACARSVLGGGQKSTEYWQWLIERWDAVKQKQPAQREVAS